MKEYSCILFDLDGTLTDPKLGITKSVNYALKKFGLEEKSFDDLEKFIGPPLYESFPLYYNFNNEETERAVKYFREYFSGKGIFENSIYPGMKDLLEHLSGKGVELIVATSKPEVFAKKIINHFKLDSYFSKVVGSKLNGDLANKSELISHVLGLIDYDKSEVLMVGDRKHDIWGTHNNGIDSIGVKYGYSKGNELEEAGATYIAENLESLYEYLSLNIHQ